MTEITRIVALMLDGKSDTDKLIFVVALVIFSWLVRLVHSKAEGLSQLFWLAYFIIFCLTVLSIFSIISPKSLVKPIAQKVTPSDISGLYKGFLSLKNPSNPMNIDIDRECRLAIGQDLFCVLYSERDTFEQSLGHVTIREDYFSSIYLPRLGWSVFELSGDYLKLHNDSLKNKDYYFNFIKYHKK